MSSPTIQLIVIVPNASSSRCAGSSPTSCSLTVSPGRPLSRKMCAVSGEITYGGLQTTRSKRSPLTGSKKLPARSSTFATPFSAVLNAANASARSFTSVATTRAA